MEAEILLLTEEEVANHPAGFGRSAPDPLLEPLYLKLFFKGSYFIKIIQFYLLLQGEPITRFYGLHHRSKRFATSFGSKINALL